MPGLEILDAQCETCIFRPGNKMHLKKGRVAQMVRDCTRDQSFITCHETMVYDDPDAGDPTASGPMCRGFFDNHGHVSQMVRIAERLGMLEFVAASEFPLPEDTK